MDMDDMDDVDCDIYTANCSIIENNICIMFILFQ